MHARHVINDERCCGCMCTAAGLIILRVSGPISPDEMALSHSYLHACSRFHHVFISSIRVARLRCCVPALLRCCGVAVLRARVIACQWLTTCNFFASLTDYLQFVCSAQLLVFIVCFEAIHVSAAVLRCCGAAVLRCCVAACSCDCVPKTDYMQFFRVAR